ncbi:MAG: DUF4365 domain-containing protein [Polyangiaceae bacterium]|nr:DUF4365 domain-containing protein [Polyangiaceae bacterium]
MPADKAHFETWARYGVPVVGIIHDPRSSDARWVNISEHLRKHPERIETGPYTLRAPSTQSFSADSFAAFAQRFVRARPPATRIDVTPNLLIRSWEPRDSGPVRALLAPIAADYPGFQAWLEKNWAMPDVSKKVVEVGSITAAYRGQ